MTPITTSTYIPARGNPWAPEWMTAAGFHPTETPAGAVDRLRVYATALLTIAANTLASNQALAIDNQYDFICREIIFKQFPVGGGLGATADSRIRWRDGQGNRITSQFVRPLDIEGPVFPELPLQRGTTNYFDILNEDSANPLSIQIILSGVNRIWL